MFTVLPEPGPLTPEELLACTPREAALIEALRGIFEAITTVPAEPPACYVLREDFNVPYCAARGAYLKIRRDLAGG